MASRASFPYRAPNTPPNYSETHDTTGAQSLNHNGYHGVDDVARDSRNREEDDSPAEYHRFGHDQSILAIVVSDKLIYAGTQAGEILVRPADPIPI